MITKLYQLGFIVPFVVFCLFLGYFAVNIPQGDDFELVLHFLTKYKEENGGFLKKLSLITDQFVEHRLFYTRFIVLLQYWMSGNVSFYLIILIGNLSLVGIFIICWQQLRFLNYPTYFLLPISLLLFQPCYSYDGVLWPAATLAYNSVSFFAILTIHWVSTQNAQHFKLAIISAAFCTYTFGNGFLILGIVALILVFQKRWKELLFWGGLTVIISIFYFTGYETLANRNKPFHNLTQHFEFIVINLLVFLGGALNWSELWPKSLSSSDLPSIVAGAFILIVFGYLIVSFLKPFTNASKAKNTLDASQLRLQYFLIGSLSFFILTGLLLCLSRVDKDTILMHINRYRVHSVVALAISYIYFIPFLQKRISYNALFVGGAFGFWILSFFHFSNIFGEYQRTYKAAQHNWATTGEWFIYRDTSYWEEASKLAMHKAKNTLNYELTASPFSKIEEKNEVVSDLKINVASKEKVVKIEGISHSITPLNKNNIYIVFRNKATTKTYLLPAVYAKRSIRLVLMGNPYYYPQFKCHISYRNFPTANYQIGIAYENDHQLEIKWQPTHFENNKIAAL